MSLAPIAVKMLFRNVSEQGFKGAIAIVSGVESKEDLN